MSKYLLLTIVVVLMTRAGTWCVLYGWLQSLRYSISTRLWTRISGCRFTHVRCHDDTMRLLRCCRCFRYSVKLLPDEPSDDSFY